MNCAKLLASRDGTGSGQVPGYERPIATADDQARAGGRNLCSISDSVVTAKQVRFEGSSSCYGASRCGREERFIGTELREEGVVGEQYGLHDAS